MATISGRTLLGEWRGVTSASRVFGNSGYEISDDLLRRKIEVLEKRYGGREKVHQAAIIIQRAFRDHRLRNCWKQKIKVSGIVRVPIPDSKCYTCVTNPLAPSPSYRYPSTSLSAQLKAQALQTQQDRIDRTPPSPSPNPLNRSMIDSLMSPRLVQRRFAPDFNSSVVWVPRSSLATQNSAHSNSLPRLERYLVRESPPTKVVRSPLTEQDRKRQYRIALNFFNKKPERGIFLLTTWGFVSDSPESVAKILFGRRGLSKQMIGEYIGTLHSTFHSCVLKYFMALVELCGLEVDIALRKSFQYFILPKETEKIDRVLQAFSVHYCKCNPKRAGAFRGGADSVHLLSFAIIMLNTDLHSPNLKNFARMKREDFIRNLRGQDKLSTEKEGCDFNRQLLEGIYERVKLDEFLPGDDHVAQVRRVDNAIVGKDKPLLTEMQRRLVCYCRLQQVDDPVKKQARNRHERDVFLFNDMLVVAKSSERRSSGVTNTTYVLKSHSPLLGARVSEFKTSYYDYGLTITTPQKEHKIHFNARNAEDRRRFVADVVESIKESEQMDEIRLELELDKLRSDNQRDSGLPEMDNHPPTRRLSFNSLDSGVVEETFENSS